jgi:thiol:disulfide interchange protein DsbD
MGQSPSLQASSGGRRSVGAFYFLGKNFTQIGKADWTNSNPEITAALKGFGRVGVPLYVLYPAADPSNPVVLPELLTESILVDALKKLP